MAVSDLFYLTSTGIVYPDYPTVLESLKDEYRTIYGDDVYLEADSQDGQWVAVLALAMYDTMQVASAVYSSYSPYTALSDALSRNVKINGIRRRVASYSSVDVLIVGQAGATIVNGQAEDTLGQKWNLPASVIVPAGGDITVTATADEIGDVSAAAGTITKIATPTIGWQTVTNPLAATEGDPVESDAELRRRQKISTAIPSLSVFEGTIGAIASLDNVSRYKGYENDTDATDSDGIPPHSIACVVEGGDTAEIAEVIATKKTAGTGTYGTTSVVVYDEYGLPNTINFFRPTEATIGVEVTIQPLAGYATSFGDEIKAAVAASVNGLAIGDDVLITKLYVPANLPSLPEGATFDITALRIEKNGGGFGTANISLTFDEVAMCDAATDVTIIVL